MGKRKSYVVWGLGRFGVSVAETLTELGHEVLGIDNNEETVQRLSTVLTHVVVTDNIDETTVKALGLRNFDVAIVGIGELQANLLCTMLLKEAGVRMIVSKASSTLHGKMLEKIGADKVIYPERDMGKRVAHNLASSNIMDYIELTDDLSLMEISLMEDLKDKTLVEADVRRKYGVNVVAIKHKDGTTEINMDPQKPLVDGDVLIVIGAKNMVLAMESGL
ncbi:Ktr system potassium uptake protein A [bioreactor metagenome]|jgi:K+ transport systems, NAD-binding component|uniref:Ktr system potassium uptake protein A n=1 Tax=bioreactor metagenome TaxID=1076179 RepID=A0A644VKZ1_9ZZZZ|nr:TrkA family potassium uptake protein [Acidaminococcaceae bacterium]